MADGATLEPRLEELLDQETFEPPEEFAEQRGRHRRVGLRGGRRRLRGLLGRAGRGAALVRGVGHRCSTSPTRRSTSGSTAASSTSSYNCLDRHVEAGNGDRVAFHWRGEEGEERDVTYADLHRDVQQLRQRAQGPRHRQGRRRRDLPADDPRGRRRDARLRAHRRDPQRRLRRLLAPSRCKRAHGVLRGQGARHRRRRPAQGQDRADQGSGRRGDGRRRRRSRRSSSSSATGRRRADDRGPRRLVPRGARGGRRRVPGRAAGRRAPAVHPLHVAARRPSRRASCTRPAAT